MKKLIGKISGGVKFFFGFLLGLITFRYLLDSPETKIENRIGKIKTKGKENIVEVENVAEKASKKPKKKIRLFKKKRRK